MRKTIYDIITHPTPSGRLRRYLPQLLLLALALSSLGLLRLICTRRGWADWLIAHVTTPLKQAAGRLFGLLPFSAAEVLWTAGVLALLVFLLRSVWVIGLGVAHRLQGRPAHPLRSLLRRALALLAAGLLVYAGYTFTWGVNYYGATFSERSGLEGRATTDEELFQLTAAFAVRCSELAGQVERDGDGQFCEGDLFARSEGLYSSLYDEFHFLERAEVRAKPMFYSRLMSALGFTGFYFPFTGESMVNVDAPAVLVPATILHELAHQKNVALEDECNFLAIVAGLKSDDIAFQYSSALMGYIHLGNALYSADTSLWREAYALLGEQARADLMENNAYWAQFDSPVEEAVEAAATNIYSGFAQSFGQEDVMHSYGACVDLLAAYYLPEEG